MKKVILIIILFYALVSAAHTDNFNRTDENPLGNGTWTTMGGIDPMAIVNNRAVRSLAGICGAYWSADSLNDDQYAQIKYVATSGNTMRVMVRYNKTARTAYCATIRKSYDSLNLDYQSNATTLNRLAAYKRVFVSGDIIKIKAVGTTISVELNGAEVISVTDTILSSGYAGIRANATNDTIDDFECDNIGGGTCAKPFFHDTALICTVDVAVNFAIASDSTDSIVNQSAFPAGVTLNKTTFTLSGTPTDTNSKDSILMLSYNCDADSTDTGYVNVTTVWGNVYLDSVAPDSGHAGDTIRVYGRGFASTQGTSTIVMGDSTPTVASWVNTLIKFPCPDLDSGWYGFTVSGPDNTDSLVNAFYVMQQNSSVIDSLSPLNGKRRYVLTYYVTGQPDSVGSVFAKINNLTLDSLSRWSSGQVKAKIPASAPRGTYTNPWIGYVDIYGDTVRVDTASTPFKCFVPGIINGGL